MTGVDRRMWICGYCGETNDGTPAVCEACDRAARGTEPTRWDALPPGPPQLGTLPSPLETREARPPLPERWEPRNAPGFRDGPPPAPRNAPPAVAGRTWPPPAPPAQPTEQPGPTWPPRERPPRDEGPSWPPRGPGPEAAWIPEAADPGGPEPQRRRLLPAIPIAVLVAALAAAGVLGGPRLFQSAGDTAPSAPAAAVAQPQPQIPIIPASKAPPLESGTAKLVAVGQGVTHERTERVAAMLETYFTGINAKDYAQVAGVLDPAGELNPDDPEQMARFSEGTATAKDSDVVLRELTDLGPGRLGADVTFRSEQEPGDGPEDRPGETCTDWRVSYTITTRDSYRILQAEGVSDPC
jgi:hypothetical protein